jgi:hypothetical protein
MLSAHKIRHVKVEDVLILVYQTTPVAKQLFVHLKVIERLARVLLALKETHIGNAQKVSKDAMLSCSTLVNRFINKGFVEN